MKLKCPKCEKQLKAPPSVQGRMAKCPRCETRFKVPFAEEPTKQPPKQPPKPPPVPQKKERVEPKNVKYIRAWLPLMSDSIEFDCVHCHSDIRVSVNKASMTDICPQCDMETPVPSAYVVDAAERKLKEKEEQIRQEREEATRLRNASAAERAARRAEWQMERAAERGEAQLKKQYGAAYPHFQQAIDKGASVTVIEAQWHKAGDDIQEKKRLRKKLALLQESVKILREETASIAFSQAKLRESSSNLLFGIATAAMGGDSSKVMRNDVEHSPKYDLPACQKVNEVLLDIRKLIVLMDTELLDYE